MVGTGFQQQFTASGTRRGVVAMFVAVAVFALMDALLKELAAFYPPLQVAGLRSAASLPFLVGPLLLLGKIRELKPVTLRYHLLRGVLGIVMLPLFVYAVKNQSLTATYGIFMCAPLMIVALSALLLREQVDGGRWLAVGAGLAGVWIMLQPDVSQFERSAGLAALGSAVCYALAAVTTRRLTISDTPYSVMFSFLLIVAVACLLLAIPAWVPVRAEHWLLITLAGLLGAIAQYTITEAFRLAPASTIAPIEYTALFWGIALDFTWWSAKPGLRLLLGAVLVVAAGLYVLHRESTTTRIPLTTE